MNSSRLSRIIRAYEGWVVVARTIHMFALRCGKSGLLSAGELCNECPKIL